MLSKFVPSGFGPGHWVADESIPNSILKQGTTAGFIEIRDIHDAAKVYADWLAEREYGESYSAVAASPDLHLENGIIFEMQAGTPSPGGGHYLMEPQSFAVSVKSKTYRRAADSIGFIDTTWAEVLPPRTRVANPRMVTAPAGARDGSVGFAS